MCSWERATKKNVRNKSIETDCDAHTVVRTRFLFFFSFALCARFCAFVGFMDYGSWKSSFGKCHQVHLSVEKESAILLRCLEFKWFLLFTNWIAVDFRELTMPLKMRAHQINATLCVTLDLVYHCRNAYVYTRKWSENTLDVYSFWNKQILFRLFWLCTPTLNSDSFVYR